jgi:hypothetical protein
MAEETFSSSCFPVISDVPYGGGKKLTTKRIRLIYKGLPSKQFVVVKTSNCEM